MVRDRNKVVLCVADDGVCLCKVADQNGRAFILSSQIVRTERFAESNENWLGEVLKNFKPRPLKQVKDVLVSTTLTHYIPLEVFYLHGENFGQATMLELENLLGDKISQFKFGVYRTEEKNIAHIFLAQQAMITKLNTVLGSVGIKRARILLSPVMFIEEGKRQTANVDTVFLNIGRNLISFVFRKKAEIVSRLLPIKWDILAKKISQIVNRNCSDEDIYQLIKNSQNQKLDQPIQCTLDEFFEELHWGITQCVDQYFGENSRVTWIVGGRHDQLFGVRQRLEKKIGRKIIPYHVAFKQQISPSIDMNTVAEMEPFIPGLLATATLDKKRLAEIANLQTDAINIKIGTKKSFFYQNFVTGLVCVISALLYFSQRLNCQYIASGIQNKKLLVEQNEMMRIAKQIEDINERIREQKKTLGDILVYIEQNRKWCELFNGLQNILAEAGDVYLTSFVWDTQIAKTNEGNSSAKKIKKAAVAKAVKIVGKVADGAEKTMAELFVTSTIAMMGSMFIGDVIITKDVEQEFNAKFNAMFDKIRKLSFCTELGDIKVNVPENGKITFRCTMEVNPKSKIMAL